MKSELSVGNLNIISKKKEKSLTIILIVSSGLIILLNNNDLTTIKINISPKDSTTVIM